jgi:hypothetical protein
MIAPASSFKYGAMVVPASSFKCGATQKRADGGAPGELPPGRGPLRGLVALLLRGGARPGRGAHGAAAPRRERAPAAPASAPSGYDAFGVFCNILAGNIDIFF